MASLPFGGASSLLSPVPDPLEERLLARLAELRAQNLERTPPPTSSRLGVRYHLGDRAVVGFCSNDYLGLATATAPHDLLAPLGAGASRLINGDHPEHRDLEARLAALVRREDAILFPSGFQLNAGVLPALITAGDRVASDRLIHASLIDGLRLATARPQILPHGHAPPLPTSRDPHWWITESIFSMDGDRCDFDALRRHLDADGLIYLDEAHAFGLFPGCAALSTVHDLPATVIVGTLGKAIGCAGAFVAASAAVCAWLRSRCRSFVFSTGISPLLARAIAYQLDRATSTEGDERRARLWRNSRLLAHLLRHPDPERIASPIFPVLLGDNALALEVSAALLHRGWHVQAIRPPTVPEGTARLRITVSADHTPAEIEALVSDLRVVLSPHGRTPTLA